ncbi:hypothetical protein GFH48_12680 [Streptomyces fagopyri]|uniref:Uncharacterized protein n=1 Tax=Streptomyces fagopyri TaxID=2662397 RepID=A0A5Q0LB77_9ACTN|nr:hypothetical protein [Streptomyces fagopyri]QFZ73986.1 hypothetical protein GFH48_12680 [Streptomyces fagopyri]
MTSIREPLHGAEADAVREQLREPSNLTISVNVARLLLAQHEQVDHRDLYAVNRAHGALAEALRLVLRAVDAEVPRSGKLSDLGERCPAAQADDPSPCDGPPIVTVYAPRGEGADGCGHHAAQLLAATNNTHPVALPDAPVGAASEVFKAAASLRYFAAHQGDGR